RRPRAGRQARDHRRRPWQGPHDRRRAGARSADEGAGGRRTQCARPGDVPPRRVDPWRRAQRRPFRAAARAHARAGRRRSARLRRITRGSDGRTRRRRIRDPRRPVLVRSGLSRPYSESALAAGGCAPRHALRKKRVKTLLRRSWRARKLCRKTVPRGHINIGWRRGPGILIKSLRESVAAIMKRTKVSVTACAISVLLSTVLAANQQPTTPSREGEAIPRLELAQDPLVEKGKVAAVQGTVGPEGLRVMVGSLSIQQPVMVMVLGRDEDDVTLSLYKKDWKSPNRTGSTRGDGIARFAFRTEGGVNIQVRGAAAATPYALVVWAGDELRPPLRDVVVTYDEFRKSNPAAAQKLAGSGAQGRWRGSGLFVPLAIAGGVVLGAVALVAIGRRSRRKRA